MIKLKKLINESTPGFTKRKFGDPLPTLEDVMKQHQESKLQEDWWDDMDASAQAQYIKAHPGSKQAQQADDDDGGEEPSGEGPSGEEKLDPQKIKDDYATAGENLTFSKGELDDAKAMGDEEEISRIQSIVDGDRKEFVASRKTYYTANQEKIEDDYDTAEENLTFSKGELDDAKAMGDEEEISRIQSIVDDDREEFRKSRRELGRMEKVVGAKSPRTGNELNQETLMIDGKQFRRISEVEKEPKSKYEFSEFYKRFKR